MTSLLVRHENRHKDIQEIIDTSFSIYTIPIHKAARDSTHLNGSENYAFLVKDNPCALRALDIAAQLFEGRKFTVLDLGTGNGLFLHSIKKVFKQQVKVMGVSAADFRHQLPKGIHISDEEYVIGNIDNLCDIPALKGRKFDLIISCHTFELLCDPIGVLAQAYELLAPDGWLVVDHINLKGLEGPCYKSLFEQYGYQAEITLYSEYEKSVYGRQVSPNANPLLTKIKKTQSALTLPILYDVERSKRACMSAKAEIFYRVQNP